MIYAVWLCDAAWRITKCLYRAPGQPLREGDSLSAYGDNAHTLGQISEKHSSVLLILPDSLEKQPALISLFSDCALVFVAHVEGEAEFERFADAYARCLNWAEKSLQLPYRDEYYQIEQMNNQLVNSQRALVKCNRRLQKALEDIQSANDTIAALEQDETTSLYCVSAFYQKTEKLLHDKPDMPFHIMALGIEHFTLAGNIFGKPECDRLLRELALFLTGLDDSDSGVLARASDDVIYICMPAHLHFYHTLDRELPHFFAPYPLPIHLCARIGVYAAENLSLSVSQMCSRARLALSAAEQSGEKHVLFYDKAMHERLLWEHHILEGIHDAFHHHEFKLYLQPKFNMRTGKQVGAEALIRWIHPEMGFVPPALFIPLLEKEGMVYDVDRYIWEETCKFLQARRKNGLPLYPISINISRCDLYHQDLIDVLLGLLEKYDLEPQNLNLEIIERAYTEDSEHVRQVMTCLREKGFRIEMDDFGTGASSLSMVAEIPVDVLKLDRSFLTSDLSNPRHVEVIRLIVKLAGVLQIKLIAEGVETQEQKDVLLSLGCEYAQGYLYSKPKPAEELLNL